MEIRACSQFLSGTIALAIAALSAIISILSLVVSYLAFRRSDAKVRVGLDIYSETPNSPKEVSLAVWNSGMGEIQLTDIRIIGSRSRLSARSYKGEHYDLENFREVSGPQIPHLLKGYHQALWKFDIDSRLGAELAKWKYAFASVAVGSGKVYSSLRYPLKTSKMKLIRPTPERLDIAGRTLSSYSEGMSNRASLTPRLRGGRSAVIPDGNHDGNDGSHQRPDAAVDSHLLSGICPELGIRYT